MIRIDMEKCIGCGKCAADCFPCDIAITDGKAVPKDEKCIDCGHCVAVCPTDAVTMPAYNMDEVLRCEDIRADIDPAVYLNHLKARRSIRRFKDTPVTEEQLACILDAGRFSPTGGNQQNVAYYIARKNLPAFRDMVFDKLKEMGDAARAAGDTSLWYSERWLEMYDEYKKDGTDRLFCHAGTVIVISSDSPQSAIIAAAHMETMVYSLGLGMLYSGFSNRAINNSPELREYLRLKPGYQVHAILVIGTPDVKYVRTVPRKPANVIWD